MAVVSIVELKESSSYKLSVENLEGLFKDVESEEVAVISVIGPESSGKYMIAGGIKAYLEHNQPGTAVLKNDDIFSLQIAGKKGITAIRRRVQSKKIKVILMICQIPTTMPMDTAKKILLYAISLSSYQIFNIPNKLTTFYRDLIQTAREWNALVADHGTEQVIVLSQVLINPGVTKYTEKIGKDQVWCHLLPSPGTEIFSPVPTANEEFRRELTKLLRELFDSWCLSGKKIGSRNAVCSELVLYTKELDSKNPEQTIKKAHNVVEAIRKYKGKMKEISRSDLIHSDLLEKHHREAKDVALIEVASGPEREGAKRWIEEEYKKYEQTCTRVQKDFDELGIRSSRPESRAGDSRAESRAGRNVNIHAHTIDAVVVNAAK